MATIFGSLPNILQNGTLADAAQVMADFNKIIGDGNANAAENGANASITSLSGLTSPIAISAGASSHFTGPTSGGTAAAQTVASTVPSNWTLTTGFMLSFNPGFSSTGATTLAVNGGSALAIRKMTAAGPVALLANDLVSGQNATVVYDGTAYLLINPPAPPSFGTLTALASAATTDLGTIASHNVQVTGTTSITSFGSSATTASPFFMITFAGALTLTYNATSLIIPGTTNLTTAANDWCIAEYLGGGNWQIVVYQKANGQAVVTPASTSGVLVGIQAFTSSGTYTPNAAATKAFAIVTGGGASGTGFSSPGSAVVGGGGGAGGTTVAFISSPSTLTVTIGAGGAGTTGQGAAGQTTSLGTITANGGGAPAAFGATVSNGGAGGAATGTGTLGIAGGDGGVGTIVATISGYGGASFWGGGGRSVSGQTTGIAGNAFGAGGSGAISTSNISEAGGAGAAGVVVVFEFK